MHIEEGISLAPLTTFRLGGPARFFCRVSTLGELRESLDYVRDKSLATLTLGGGSNVLVPDVGFDGLVIKIELSGIEVHKSDTGAVIIAGAGERWDALVARAVAEGLWGLENLSGIPGTVGGGVVQGIGAYGAAIGQTLVWVEVFDCNRKEVRRLNLYECAFAYRGSVFKHHPEYVVLRAAFALTTTPAPNLSYRDVEERLKGTTPTLESIRETIIDIRRDKFPDLLLEGTAGSFFKNPILPQEEAQALMARYPGMPLFTLPEAQGVKVPLAWLLDHALNLKGERVGGARLFERQPLVIVTGKGATAANVRALAERVASRVQKELGISVEPEVKIL